MEYREQPLSDGKLGRQIVTPVGISAIIRAQGDRNMIAIDGPGGTGKSVLAQALAALLEASVVRVDDFYRPSSDRGVHLNEPYAGEFDLVRLQEQVLEPISHGMDATYQVYGWDLDRIHGSQVVRPSNPIIVEGVYALHRKLRGYYSFSIFCTAQRAVRLKRGLHRDGEEAISRWAEVWMPQEDRYIKDQHPDHFADLVLLSFDASGDGVLRFHTADPGADGSATDF